MPKKMNHEISDQITDEKIISKMGVISDTFNDLKSSLTIGKGLQLCDSTLLLAVRSYFYDVLRYKHFHNTPRRWKQTSRIFSEMDTKNAPCTYWKRS